MAEAIIMPELGQTVSGGTIAAWLVEEGASVEMGDPLLSVETDKTELEVESVAEGVLLKQVFPAGSEVESGTVIAYVGEAGDDVPS
ncbi:biotin/lipoyl-containing protein [Kineococcus aurantiacus]|uniref:Pyruvate/2-oxoglutarate dehydrogenase complex dihydrolipoamide acyltransferase (E2) component n=1 Tax=Kineococcus aurantiacus TaxID=37633 RepID=A0A7Y9DQZ5_9ACTN|nr:biotin/lipoyl-containing protein [Kineococcus aurantiacus]NYD25094.1 pyruvate/2-oxoglutarate dehydrogenase complex dihydrolipoamide acyltransferase (E2) component [Kineococcus aurantiacus]